MAIERERSWVIDMERKLERTNTSEVREEENQWKKTCIFRLPEFLRKIKQDVFTPKVVAIGPYHHRNSNLQSLESHKERALRHFLKRGDNSLGVYVREMESVVELLQASYSDLDEEWKNKDDFIKLMITDGCFMLEVMRLDSELCEQYAPSDPFFGHHALQYKVPYLRRDMLIVENQLPILVFNKLISVEMDIDEETAECITKELIVRFFIRRIYEDKKALTEFTNAFHGLHVLDIYRRGRLCQNLQPKLRIGGLHVWDIFLGYLSPERDPPLPITNFVMMRSATRLREAGISFKQSNSSALNDIHFDSRCGILTLPVITVDYSTEYELLNMVAFEQLHAECGNEISSYVAFMGKLIDSTQDVGLLHRYRLINNGLGSDEDFAKLFNSMSKEVIVDQGGSLGSVQEKVEKYCQKSFNKRMAYFNLWFWNPSTILTLVAIEISMFSLLVSIFKLIESI